MSRRAIIKRAKILRGRKISNAEFFDRIAQFWRTAIKPNFTFKIEQQPVSEMTEKDRAERRAPIITITIVPPEDA